MNVAFAVTPSDTQPLPANIRSFYVGVSGNISAVFMNALQPDSAPVVLQNVPVGPIKFERAIGQIMATNTTASAIVGFTM
jgi:hypothetical protein